MSVLQLLAVKKLNTFLACGGAPPVCSNCLAFNLNCTYNDTTKKRGPPKGYIEAIESRLYKMESLMGELAHSNDPRAEAILAELMKDDLHPLHKARKVNYAAWRNRLSSLDDTSIADSSTNANTNDYEIGYINDAMGILSIDEENQVSYYGRSSGLQLLKHSDRYKNGILSFSNNINNGQTSTSNQKLVLHSELPSQELSDHLLELYFKHVHTTFPIIYKPRFFELLKDHKNPPYLLLNSIYTLASNFSDCIEVRKDRENPLTAGDVYFDRAKALLDSDYDRAHITNVQALLLLSLREYGAGRVTRSWIYTGMAARMAQSLGLHRNNEKCYPITLSHGEKEEQKRVFWGCYVLDRIPSVHFGRPLAIDEKDVDAAHPSEDGDDDYESLPFKMKHTESLVSSPNSTNNDTSTQVNKESKEPRELSNSVNIISRFNCLIRLCEIMGRILQNVYAIKCNQASVSDSVISILESSLKTWFITLPPHLQYNPLDQHLDNLDVSTLSLHVIYYESLMLLHRPFVVGNNSSHKILTSSAEVISEIIDSMFRQNTLKNALPVIIYGTFITSVVHACNANEPDTTISQSAKMNLARCIRALESLKNNWILSHKYISLIIGLVDLKGLHLDTNQGSPSDSTESNRNLKKRNTLTNNQPNPFDTMDRYGRQARYRAHESSVKSQPFNNSNALPTFQRHSSVMSHNNSVIVSSPSFTFNQTQQSQQLRHNFQESFNNDNSFGFRNMTTTATTYSQPQTQTQTQSNVNRSDPFAAQGVISTNNGVCSLNSGFWNLPQSANFEEWSSYLHSQQVQQSVTLPSQPPSMSLQPLLLHDNGNNVNVFTNNQTTLMSEFERVENNNKYM
ncbi:26160_t:CDS:2 [Dentiscutata erythropus]|uniref:26160_t:CDS:1 n=1 Tax=Dentiscutata erythropus TaxID=1348616 RepID=A0A9N9B984_9GLOM|nr:26160_t:CDS:2 [Dentiscutata erythropus]